MELNHFSLPLFIFAYLLGAVPFGYIIARVFYKIDIREHGSKNVGATNVWRTLGKKPGMATLGLDILKGFIPVFLAARLNPTTNWAPYACGLAAILGHNWSIFLKGKGGKGVATSAGVFLALVPMEAGLALLTFIIIFLVGRFVSLGSVAAALTLIISTFYWENDLVLRILVLLASMMVIIKHIPNIQRLLKGVEPRVSFK